MIFEVQKDLLRSLFVLANVVEAKDPYTAGHLWRVSQFSSLLGSQFGFTLSENSALVTGAFLHDLGKIGIPDSILNKKSKLENFEYSVIKTHPSTGVTIIRSHPLVNLVRLVIEQHHEMPNGKGYPYGLDWNQVSIFSRIVGICDAFDAMTSTRPYRSGMTIEKAISILKEESGNQFDSELVGHFLQIPLEKLQHIVGHSEEGIPILSCPVCFGPVQIGVHTKDGDTGICRACVGSFLIHKNVSQSKKIELEFQEKAKPESTIYQDGLDDGMIDRMISEFPNKLEVVDMTKSQF